MPAWTGEGDGKGKGAWRSSRSSPTPWTRESRSTVTCSPRRSTRSRWPRRSTAPARSWPVSSSPTLRRVSAWWPRTRTGSPSARSRGSTPHLPHQNRGVVQWERISTALFQTRWVHPNLQSYRIWPDAGVEKLCEVESDLSGIDDSRFKEKNKRFWKPGKTYYEVSYQVQVIIGPADLHFELCKYRTRPRDHTRHRATRVFSWYMPDLRVLDIL